MPPIFQSANGSFCVGVTLGAGDAVAGFSKTDEADEGAADSVDVVVPKTEAAGATFLAADCLDLSLVF